MDSALSQIPDPPKSAKVKRKKKIQGQIVFFVVHSTRKFLSRDFGQGCQILLGTKYQSVKNIPNDPKMYQIATKCKYQMAVKNVPKASIV
jgi:hypothetical protein